MQKVWYRHNIAVNKSTVNNRKRGRPLKGTICSKDKTDTQVTKQPITTNKLTDKDVNNNIALVTNTTINDKYPGSPGLIWLSRIGFNTEGSQALVYVQQMVRILDGTSYLALLVRMDDTWVFHSAVKETPLDGTKFIEFSGRR